MGTQLQILKPSDRLIVALDFPTVGQAADFVEQMGTLVSFYKVGLQLILSPLGMAFAEKLARAKRLFLDPKLLDIENTVRGGVRSASHLGATFLTVHGYPKAMRAACAERDNDPLREDSRLHLLAVTVLTDLDSQDLQEAGYDEDYNPSSLVFRRAKQAMQIGMDGVICSPQEVEMVARLRTTLSTETYPELQLKRSFVIVTPGIRPLGDDHNDQKRVSTPTAAIQAGADYLVVGRPITAAPDPVKAAAAIVQEIEDAKAHNIQVR